MRLPGDKRVSTPFVSLSIHIQIAEVEEGDDGTGHVEDCVCCVCVCCVECEAFRPTVPM